MISSEEPKTKIHPPFKESLIDAGIPGGSTTKQTFLNRPDIVVRSNPFDDLTAEQIRTGKLEYDHLKQFGILTLNTTVLITNEAHQVTQKVTGENLEFVLTQRGNKITKDHEQVCLGLLEYLKSRAVPGSKYLNDIYKISQFMYGTTPKDPKPRIYLVDTELRTFTFSTEKGGAYNWIIELLTIIEHMQRAENLTGYPYPNLKKMLIHTLEDISYDFPENTTKLLLETINSRVPIDHEELEDVFGIF